MSILLLTLLACSDTTVKSFNTAPSALIAYPTEGAVFADGDLVAFEGVVGDDDSPPTDLQAAWRIDGVEVCAPAAASVDGETRCEATLEVGSHEITLVVEDPGGQAASDTVNITVQATEAPTVSVTSPEDGATVVAGELVALMGVVGDAEDDPGELSVWWTLDGEELAVSVSVDTDGDVTSSHTFTEAAEHTLTLHAEDSDGKTASETITLTVQAAPGSPSCSIDSPSDGTVVEVSDGVDLAATVSDPDQSPETLGITWTSDIDGYLGASTADSTGAVTFSRTLSQADHTVSMVITDSTGLTCSDYVTVVVDQAPTVEVVSPGSGTVFQDGEEVEITLSVSDVRDSGSELTVTWESDVDGSLGSASPDGDGELVFSEVLTVGSHALTFTATDSHGFSATDSLGVVVNGPPSAPVVSISPASPATGDGLVASVTTASVDPDGGSVSYSYAWTRDGESTSYSSTTVPASATTKEEEWEVSVVATDTEGGSSAPATASVTIQDTAPAVDSLSFSPSGPTATDSITVTAAGSDVDGDTVTFRYAWQVNGSSVSETSRTLSSGFEKDDVVSVTVTPVADGVSGDTETSSVTVQDTPPTIGTVSLSPSSPTVTDDLTANATGSDIDGDTVSFRYAWTVEGASVSESDATLSTGFAKGEVVAVTVTAVADGVSGTSASASVTIQNTPPTAPVVSISPDEPYAGEDTLTCSIDAFSTDADGDTITYAVAWTVDGSAAGVSGYTVSRDDIVPGEFWVCTVTPSDDEEAGASASASVTVRGDPVDYAHIQYPCSTSTSTGEDVTVYGWVYVIGVTDEIGAGAGIEAQVGYGPTTDDPSDDDSTWTWFDATYNADKDGLAPGDHANDEYQATLTAPYTTGTYAYVYRFTTDYGASWVYADLGDECGGSGTIDGFDVDDAGVMTVY